jgi:IclR family mhp operon transcriptional activator
LKEAHRLSGLPKSTAKRLLDALVRRNLVRRGLSDGYYRLNITMPSPGEYADVSRIANLVRAAAPHMVDLTRSIGWPADLLVFRNGRMQIIETTHTLSPFDPGNQRIYDIELNIFAAAGGIAYLSTLTDEQVRQQIKDLDGDERFSLSRYGIPPSRLFQEIERARGTGFARRLVGQTGALSFNAIAAPIFADEGCIGAISVWWPKTYSTPTAFLKMHSVRIGQASSAVSEALRRR